MRKVISKGICFSSHLTRYDCDFRLLFGSKKPHLQIKKKNAHQKMSHCCYTALRLVVLLKSFPVTQKAVCIIQPSGGDNRSLGICLTNKSKFVLKALVPVLEEICFSTKSDGLLMYLPHFCDALDKVLAI